MRHTEVTDAAMMSVRDEKWGETVRATITPTEGTDASEPSPSPTVGRTWPTTTARPPLAAWPRSPAPAGQYPRDRAPQTLLGATTVWSTGSKL